MALWHVLVLGCFGATLGCALVPPRVADAGIAGYLVASAIGVVVGSGCAWLMWLMHKGFQRWMLEHPEISASQRERYSFAFYVSKLLWIAFAMTLGYGSSLFVQRLLR